MAKLKDECLIVGAKIARISYSRCHFFVRMGINVAQPKEEMWEKSFEAVNGLGLYKTRSSVGITVALHLSSRRKGEISKYLVSQSQNVAQWAFPTSGHGV